MVNKFILLIVLWLLCVVVSAIALLWMLASIFTGSRRSYKIAFGFDQTANATFGGSHDEKISSRAWRERSHPKWESIRKLIDTLFWFDPEHCENSYNNEVSEALTYLERTTNATRI